MMNTEEAMVNIAIKYKYQEKQTDVEKFNLLPSCLKNEIHIKNKTLGRAWDPRANGAWLNKQTE